jgi:surface antigen
MNRSALPVVSVALLLALSACATDGGYGSKQIVGAGLGAVVGGVAGAQFGGGTGQLVTTAAGAVLGSYLGSEAGASMDRSDRMYYGHQAAPRAAVPSPSRYAHGANCREFRDEVVMDGQRLHRAARACRQPDGSWLIID